MECRICGKYFNEEITFASLFVPRTICPRCKTIFVPKIYHECIPFTKGIINYFSIYDFENNDYRQDTWLFKNMDKCFCLAINSQSDYDIIICIGPVEYETATDWLPVLVAYHRILMISLFYYAFERYEYLL
ncbi:MAG: hypothetical protein WC363_03825 [Candidatus Izemoplasmatales bacterium]|jgi:hypothetical protein|nr:hypothetical protein [Candidatus Izemoplasmatales bacterium]